MTETLTTDALLAAYAAGRRDFSSVKIDNGLDEDGYAIPNERNLRGASLVGIDLHGANLKDVLFIEADLTNADLSHAQFSGTDFTRADLTGANLSYTNLLGADLSNAICTRTNLSHLEDFDGLLVWATFIGATFEGTTVSSADRDQIAAVLEGALLDDNPDDETRAARERGIAYIRESGNCWSSIVRHERSKNPQALAWGLAVLSRYDEVKEMVDDYNADLWAVSEDVGIRCEPGEFSDLHEGDAIGIHEDSYGSEEDDDAYPATVSAVYPSGVIEVSSDDLDTMHFFPSGRNIDGNDSEYTLLRWTSEVADRQEAKHLRDEILGSDLDDVALPALRVIVAAINGTLPGENDAPQRTADATDASGSQERDSREYEW